MQSLKLFRKLNGKGKRGSEIVKLTVRVVEKLDSGRKGYEVIAMLKRQGE